MELKTTLSCLLGNATTLYSNPDAAHAVVRLSQESKLHFNSPFIIYQPAMILFTAEPLGRYHISSKRGDIINGMSLVCCCLFKRGGIVTTAILDWYLTLCYHCFLLLLGFFLSPHFLSNNFLTDSSFPCFGCDISFLEACAPLNSILFDPLLFLY